MAKIRSPICSVLGHVDHGKSSILDKIRGTAIVSAEAGGITQAIGASIIPFEVIKRVCDKLLEATKQQFTIPGILFIDTPGHAAFTNLRKRGGNLADIAIVVVDINEGMMPQTIEAVEILKSYKTPFVVAANKLDLVPGWKTTENSLIASFREQNAETLKKFDTKLYELVGKLSEFGFNSQRFDRVSDYTKEIAIIPVSAHTGQGIAELLMVLAGLAQRFLENSLRVNVDSPAKGTILEVKEEKGLGTTVDVIIYDGTLKKNDPITIGSLDEPVVTKVRGLFEPAGVADMRDKKSKFRSVNEVSAATGVKIAAPNLDGVIAGMPLQAGDADEIKEKLKAEIDEVLIETDDNGIVVKADTLGSIEALIKILRDEGIEIRKATIGNISKKDIIDAESNFEKDPTESVVLGFNVKVNEDAKGISKKVKIFTNDVIYRLIEDYQRWVKEACKALEAEKLDHIVKPCKIEIMRGYVFRQNNPAIVGCYIIVGSIRTGTQLMKNGKVIGSLKSIQHEKESLKSIEAGKQVALGIEGATVGRQIEEGDTLYSSIPEDHFRILKSLAQYLSSEEKEVMKEIASIMRDQHPMWGV